MKPIKLKIKGLNSFIDEQTIDFKVLSKYNLFGIFGPTGSGKSTILDGITLALYGNMPRKSSNYINATGDSLNVSFEFQISNKTVRTYKVVRTFLRDKNGSIRASKCSLIEKTNGNEEILAEKTNAVTSKCTEIIGLGIDDFTKTVMLPQGRFSDFLKLQGKERREMLERLFNLQEYGDELSRKLGFQINKTKDDYNLLLGELKGYEYISEEDLKIKEEDFKTIFQNYKISFEKFKRLEEQFNRSNELFELTVELNNYKNEQKNLSDKKEEIENNKKRADLAKSALKLMPDIISLDDIINKMSEIKKIKEDLEKKHSDLEIKLNETNKKWEESSEDVTNKLPKLNIKEVNIKDAIENQKQLQSALVLCKQYYQHKENLSKEKAEKESEIETLTKQIETMKNSINEFEKRNGHINIPIELKDNVQKGRMLQKEINSITDEIKKHISKSDDLTKEINNYNEELIKSNKSFEQINYEISKNRDKLKGLEEYKPKGQNDILDLQKEITEVSDKKQKQISFSDEINKSKEEIIKLNKELEISINKKNKVTSEYENIMSQFKLKQNEIVAQKIRKNLHEGEECPVCGCIYHSEENEHILIINEGELNILETKVQDTEKSIKEIEKIIVEQNYRIQNQKDNINKFKISLKELGSDFNEKSVEYLKLNLSNIIKQNDKYNKEKEILSDKEKILIQNSNRTEQKINITKTKLEEIKKQLAEIKKEIDFKDQILSAKSSDIKNIKLITGINDFESRYQEILMLENEKNENENKLKNLRDKLEQKNKEVESANKYVSDLEARLIKGDSVIFEKEQYIEEKKKAILEKAGTFDNLKDILQTVQNEITIINQNHFMLKKEKEETELKSQENKNKLSSVDGQESEMKVQKESLSAKIEFNLIRERFESIDEVKQKQLSEVEINNILTEIENYNTAVSKNKGSIELLEKKLEGSETIDKETLEKVKSEKETEREISENLNKDKINKEKEIEIIKEKLIKLKKLINKKEKLEHTRALLDDLDKLFKGKKFVEYVSLSRLKVITKNASTRLFEITGGKYGLDIDDDSKFLIRDYRSFEKLRDASTLSGGETFLVSLCLALSLSSEIQLKGTAPIELFFLDEGFGTLDDNLIDVVLDSIEKIKNKNLTVGIISHVEAIKDRLPVKLLVHPAELGASGSSVEISID